MLHLQIFAQDCDQNIDAHGDPDVGLHHVLGGAEKPLEVQVLLHPFEAQFDLPLRFVEGSGDVRRPVIMPCTGTDRDRSACDMGDAGDI